MLSKLILTVKIGWTIARVVEMVTMCQLIQVLIQTESLLMVE